MTPPHPVPALAQDLGLYLHVPFCSHICNYCNFNRGLYDASLARRYVAALEREIRGTPGAAADTVFFGGGTPSLLEPSDIGRLITACRETFLLAADTEVTLEANPETVDLERLEGYRRAGVTRLSLGVQSFLDDELRRLDRIHSAQRARAAVAAARAAGYDNVSVDLMLWLPGQCLQDSLASVDAVIDLAADHASLYLLELYPNAPLREDMARSGWSLAPDDDAADMYLAALERLEAAGLEQYEISNVAIPGHRCRHNLKYWTDGDWAGFGCGAHSTRAGIRWKNVSATLDYIERIEQEQPVDVDRRELSNDDRLAEAIFMGLRLTDGIDLAGLEARYGVDVGARFGPDLVPYAEAGLLRTDDGSGRLRLTRAGMLVANDIMALFV